MSGCPIARMIWMRNRCIADLDAEVLAVFLKYSAYELGPVVSNDPVWDPEPTDN
jgi:hypothetical protein